MEQLLNPANAEVRVAFQLAEAEIAQHTVRRATAEVYRAIDAALTEAEAHPEVFVDHPHLWGKDAIELAVRAAAADLAVRLSVSDVTVRSKGSDARTLREKLPELWEWFRAGDVAEANIREAVMAVSRLQPHRFAEFEAQILGPARSMTRAKFRTFVHALAERLLADTATERNEDARKRRDVWTEVDRDGMAYLHAYLPADDIAKITARLEHTAFGHYTQPDEQRTMAQLKADTLVDLLAGTGKGSAVGVTVALTVPIMSLLGESTELAVLEGVGPIDLKTARRLTAAAPSLTRLLTDPVSGEIVTMDSEQYRPTAALRRWIALTQATCDFPGCNRRAAHCDLDHSTAWSEGGATTAKNLVYRCRKHHRMKHETKWQVRKPPGAARATWISPTGIEREADPPPF
jgi:hypothetical protein